MAGWTMKRRWWRNGLGGGLLLLSGGATLLAGTPPTVDMTGGRDPSGTIVIAPPELRGGDPNPPPAPAAEPVQPGNPLWAIPMKDLSVTRERPIFSPSRRPPPPAVAAAPYVPPPPPRPAGPQRPQLALVGTVVNSKEGFGIFLDQTTNTVLRLKTGENHHGWILLSVQGREATLQKDRDTTVLALPARGADQPGMVPANVSGFPSAAEPLPTSPAGGRYNHDD